MRFITDSEGNFDRPAAFTPLNVPGYVALESDSDDAFLVWDIQRTAKQPMTYATPDSRLLFRFIRLADGDAEAILVFARRWGVLSLDDRLRTKGREPIADWWKLARKFRACLALAVAIQEGSIGNQSDWDLIDPSPKADGFTLPVARRKLYLHLEGLVRKSDLTISPSFENDGWRIYLRFAAIHGLTGVLAFQLLLGATDAGGLFICSGCRLPYLRERNRRLPKSGNANFCLECVHAGRPKEAARRRYQARKREKC